MIVKNLLFFITTVLVLGCKQTHQNDYFNESAILIHHQIIIDNPNNLSGSFFLYSNSGHHYAINESDTMNILNGSFTTPLKNWDENSIEYIVMFYYVSDVGFGCINVEINTFTDFELYHTNNFVVGEVSNNSFCAWNENSFQYSIVINN